jgi:FkbM family methyltransferase
MVHVKKLLGLRRTALQDGGDAARPGTLLTLRDLADGPRLAMEAAVRSRCHCVALDPTTVLCRILGRYKFLVDSRDIGLAPHLMLDGFWESWCTEFMLRRIRPGMVAWDVGANLGYFAVLMADLVGPQGSVLAVEPNPRMALLCERSLAMNGFWRTARVERLAVSDLGGLTLRFRAAASDPKNGRFSSGGGALPVDGDVTEFAVRTARLDDLATGPVDFLKMDVEGAEEQAWAGMQGLLDRSPDITLLMEFNALRCRAPEDTLRAIAARFPLRELHLDGVVRPVAAAEILPREEDTLLVLTRGAA